MIKKNKISLQSHPSDTEEIKLLKKKCRNLNDKLSRKQQTNNNLKEIFQLLKKVCTFHEMSIKQLDLKIEKLRCDYISKELRNA